MTIIVKRKIAFGVSRYDLIQDSYAFMGLILSIVYEDVKTREHAIMCIFHLYLLLQDIIFR